MDIKEFKDCLSTHTYGMTAAEAISKGICINCKIPQAASKCYSLAGVREYYNSGLCEQCFDAITLPKPVSESLLDQLQPPVESLFGFPFKYYLTGSSVYGEQTAGSDIDICISIMDVSNVHAWLDTYDIPWEYLAPEHAKRYPDGTHTFYVEFAFLTLNFIVCNTPEEMQQWIDTTEQMKKQPAVEDKQERKRVFRELFLDAEV